MNKQLSAVSVASTSSLPSATSLAKSSSFSSSVTRTPSSASWAQSSTSISSTLANQASFAPSFLDPDELFTKYSVAEVRNVQLRLRADADAKQEELRVMVGERYRDLIQASSSIIAIAESSRRVQEILGETRALVPSPDLEIQVLKKPNLSRKDDSHLKTLQSLAAHTKLLLDTPEHLWRLIERKKYLHAGWLFLLARVIHHALIRPATEGDEEDWKTHGIDIDEQFPLVQRQWEAIGQFKSQIIHKATLSLRDSNISTEDICSVLLTLHLLDSEPLTKTLNTFLLQRSRSLQSALARAASTASQPLRQVNGSASRARGIVHREARESLENALFAITLTVGATRRIFRDTASVPSLMTRVLTFIDAPQSSLVPPSELQMSTQNLLANLPSASHFMLLPASIRLYRPYVDLASPTTTITPAYLTERLEQWFEHATAELKRVAVDWFVAVDSLTDLWELRQWAQAWAKADAQLDAAERDTLLETVDALMRAQAATLWKTRLKDMENVFETELLNAITALINDTEEGLFENSPISFLFQALPHVSTYKLGGASMAAAFQKYSDALGSQITGRMPLLDKVLSTVEERSAELHKDLRSMSGDDEGGDGLLAAYKPDVEDFFTAVVSAISSCLERIEDNPEPALRALAFLSRLALELSSSPFLLDIRHGTDAGLSFEEQARVLYGRALEQWQQFTCKGVVASYMEAWSTAPETSQLSKETSGAPFSPSSSLMQALLSLSTACYSVDASVHTARTTDIASTMLKVFVQLLLDKLRQRDAPGVHRQHILSDLRLLRQITFSWGGEWESATNLLQDRIKTLESKVDSMSPSGSDAAVSNHLSSTHTLLAPFLPLSYVPTNPTHLKKASIPNGALFPGANSQLAMELVKPGPRFGLLLVESITTA